MRDSAPLSNYRQSRELRRYPRRSRGERLRSQLSSHRPHVPTVEDLSQSARRMRYSTVEAVRGVRNPTVLLRALCAAAAIVLLLFLISSGGSPNSTGPRLSASSQTGAGSQGGASASSTASPSISPAAKAPPPAAPARKGSATPRKVQKTASAPRARSSSTASSASTASSVRTVTVTRTTTAPAKTTTTSASTTPTTSTTPTKTATTPTKTTSGTTTTPTKTTTSGDGKSGGTKTGGGGGTAASSGGVMSLAAFQGLPLTQTTLSGVTAQFGSTATPSQMGKVFGSNWVLTIIPYQPAGQSCVYYLPRPTGAKSVFQLCFNSANRLADKTVIQSPSA